MLLWKDFGINVQLFLLTESICDIWVNFFVSKDQTPKGLQEVYKLVKHKVHILGLQEYSL